MAETRLAALLQELLALPAEAEWIEFKQNNANPQASGEYLSAIANSAALHGRDYGYLIWGVEDASHHVTGTTFRPRQQRKGNEELENWLMRLLEPRIAFRIHEFRYRDAPVVIFEVPSASFQPIRFSGEEFVRIGSSKRKLKDYPEKERQLWGLFQHQSFEKGFALTSVSSDEVLEAIDYPAAFKLLGQRLPDNREGILDRLAREQVIIARGGDRFDVTNLGAVLFATKLGLVLVVREGQRLDLEAVRRARQPIEIDAQVCAASLV